MQKDMMEPIRPQDQRADDEDTCAESDGILSSDGDPPKMLDIMQAINVHQEDLLDLLIRWIYWYMGRNVARQLTDEKGYTGLEALDELLDEAENLRAMIVGGWSFDWAIDAVTRKVHRAITAAKIAADNDVRAVPGEEADAYAQCAELDESFPRSAVHAFTRSEEFRRAARGGLMEPVRALINVLTNILECVQEQAEPPQMDDVAEAAS